MAFWEAKQQDYAPQDAYINETTRYAMKGEFSPKAGDRFKSDYSEMLATNPNLANDIKEQANAALATAKDLMAKLKENGLEIYRKEFIEETEEVEEKLNKASVKVDIFTSKDDGHKYLATSINIEGTGKQRDTFVARVEDGNITGVSIRRAYSPNNTLEPVYGANNIAAAEDVADNLKAIAKFVADNGMIHYKSDARVEYANSLFANRPTREIEGKDGTTKSVPDTYAKIDNYGNIVVSSQQLPNITITFGQREDGDAYVRATNWAMTRDGKPRDRDAKDADGKTVAPLSLFVKDEDNFKELVGDFPELIQLYEMHTGISSKEQTVDKTDKSKKTVVERD